MTSAEYYFDYKIQKVSGDESIGVPKLYFERDYTNADLAYTVFLVPEEWLDRANIVDELRAEKDEIKRAQILTKLEYDTIRTVFDMRDVMCAPLTDTESREYFNAEKKTSCGFDEFYKAGCKIVMENDNTPDHSGVGVIEMMKGNVCKAKFFFAVNFIFKKKLFYKLEVENGKLNATFTCDSCPKGIPVRIVYNQDRLPCLKNDMGVNIVYNGVLDFSKGEKCEIKGVGLTDGAENTGNKFSCFIPDSDISRYYLLECTENNTLRLPIEEMREAQVNYSCPYCHKSIDRKIVESKAYKKGSGAQCQPIHGDKEPPKILGTSNCIYCTDDLNDKLEFKSERNRLLPYDFLGHQSFKIAFSGSVRAGKTTYISRFFDVNGDDKISMPMTMTKNAISQFDIDIKSVIIPELVKSGSAYKITKKDWAMAQNYYKERSINLYKSRYPQPTNAESVTHPYPFITEVNGNTYVSFYDIAGEDAQHSTQVKEIGQDEIIGIFCLINGNADRGANEKVINMLRNANLNPRCPVAVMVTKMDMLEDSFDSNCRCLRTDYFESEKEYSESRLKREIDISSLEIESFLQQKGLVPNFGDSFENVKYFGISSFNFFDSIHKAGDDPNNPGKVRFSCSSKRMELPFVWLLFQLGIIR